MDAKRPIRLLAVGTALALAGWLGPFLMVLRMVEPSFPLAFASYAMLLAGTLLGIVGAVEYRRMRGDGGRGVHDA